MPLSPVYASPHFTFAELTASSTADAMKIPNVPDKDVSLQLFVLANATLEGIRAVCGGHSVYISSGYRCPELNAAVGGVSDSAHLYGCAADLTIPDFGDVDAVCAALKPYLVPLQIDQLINETGGGGGARWIHVGRAIPPNVTPRYQSFSA